MEALPARISALAEGDDSFCKYATDLGAIGVTTKVVEDNGSTNGDALEELREKVNAIIAATVANKC